MTPEEDPNFTEFWTVYPRRVGKGQARRAWKTALSKTTVESLLSGARRYAELKLGTDPQYIKHPSTWLNGECWEDEIPAPSTYSRAGGVKSREHLSASAYTPSWR